MKKKFTFLMPLLIVAIFSNLATAQQSEGEKRIVITIRSTNADGSTNTSIVEKSGESARNFDVKKYVEQQTKDNPNAVVEINTDATPQYNTEKRRRNYDYSDHFNKAKGQNDNADHHGFLGVSPNDEDETASKGVRVHITQQSGAAQAGLKNDDVIVQLNKTPLSNFSDISTFMRTTKPNDKVEITYLRDGATKTTTATLSEPQDAWSHDYFDKKEACLGVYISSYAVDAARGALIDGFTDASAAREVAMQKGDVIVSVNGARVKSYQETWDEIAKYKPNASVTVAYMRDKAPFEVKATLKACRPHPTETKITIVVPKKAEVATPQVVVTPTNLGQLALERFVASPNPTKDVVNISFSGASVPTSISFYDVKGQLLFQQNLTDFGGEYNQRFDVNEFAKGVLVDKVQQGDKVFSKQIVVN